MNACEAQQLQTED